MDKPTETRLSKKEFITFCTVAHEQCTKVNPPNPLAVANQIEAACKELERFVEYHQKHSLAIPCLADAKTLLAAIKEA